MERWKDDPEEHDYPAAQDYLELLMRQSAAAAVVKLLRKQKTITKKAKDISRAAQLPLLDGDNYHVKKDLKKLEDGEKLSPVLLVRCGLAEPLVIADGYHRVCAVHHLDEDAEIPCRIASMNP